MQISMAFHVNCLLADESPDILILKDIFQAEM